MLFWLLLAFARRQRFTVAISLVLSLFISMKFFFLCVCSYEAQNLNSGEIRPYRIVPILIRHPLVDDGIKVSKKYVRLLMHVCDLEGDRTLPLFSSLIYFKPCTYVP